MRRQLVPGLVVRLTVIKAKTWPGTEATLGPCSLAGIARCMAAAQEKNDLTSNLITTFAVLVSRIMNHSVLYLSVIQFYLLNHTQNVISGCNIRIII